MRGKNIKDVTLFLLSSYFAPQTPQPSARMGRLYLLHREKIYYEKGKEGGHTGFVLVGGVFGGGGDLEPIKTTVKRTWASNNIILLRSGLDT